jgi:GH43 family beta-xylosidase
LGRQVLGILVSYYSFLDSRKTSVDKSVDAARTSARATTKLLACLALLLGASAYASSTFTNPLLPSGPDPWVLYDNGFYYYTNTTGNNITLWRTRDITNLRNADKKVIWIPPPHRAYSYQLWAPELHKVKNKWYVYFTADAGTNPSHRLWVLKDGSTDPLSGTWKFAGSVKGVGDHWAIDPTIFEHRGRDYIVWSGWPNGTRTLQGLYIAQLKSPTKIKGKPVLISEPQYQWERFGDVNEGPEVLKHDSKLFLVYSASGCWTDHYALGMLVASEGSNLLDPDSWHKIERPVLSTSAAARAFGTGHNTFFKSPDGTQDWILYHANPAANEGCGNDRSPRAQPFIWGPDGWPVFGDPVPIDQPLPKPAGTPDPG